MMSVDDSSSNAGDSADQGLEVQNTPEEHRALVSQEEDASAPHVHGNGRFSQRGEDICNSTIAPFFIVILAFTGIAVYFIFSSPGRKGSNFSRNGSIKDVCAPTILVSIDGFRYEYLSRKTSGSDGDEEPLAPNLYAVADQGVYAEGGMQPVFPTVTFPNHWSLVTGLFPEYHGIVGNTM